jgi:hypothetical protein
MYEADSMLVGLEFPQSGLGVGVIRLLSLHAAEGDLLGPGAHLADVSLDLSAGVAHDCPPISTYRIVLREPLWLRRLLVGQGEDIGSGASLALLTTTPDEAIEGPPARAARVTIAAILHQSDWWGSEA